MIEPGDDALGEKLANTLLHESTHSTYFVRGQSTLNESVASFVGDHLAIEYLRAHAEMQSASSGELNISDEDASVDRASYFVKAFAALETLYESTSPNAEKLEKKGRVDFATTFARPRTSSGQSTTQR